MTRLCRADKSILQADDRKVSRETSEEVLAIHEVTGKDAVVAMPEDDVAARGRSIFERLRAEQVGETPPPSSSLFRWSELPDLPEVPAIAPPERPSDAIVPLNNAAAVAAQSVEASGDARSPRSPALASSDEPGPVPRSKDYVATPPIMPTLPSLSAPEAGEPASPRPSSARRSVQEERPEPGSFARPLPRILAIANQKGGVGKTTTTVNLGASLAVLGYRTLVVDLDPQGNATTGLGINSRNLEHSIYDVILHDVPMEDCVEPSTLRNLYVAPATIDLAGAEIELVPAFSRELRLRRALEEVRDDYDFVLIDCPPSLGLLTVNGLAAATEVLVPIQCEYYALEGLGQLLRNVNLVQSNLNPKLEVSAIVLTMYDARTKLAEQVAAEVRTHFGSKVCRNVVPRTVRLSEAPSFGQPIIVFDPSSRGALAYRELAKEVSGGAPQRAG